MPDRSAGHATDCGCDDCFAAHRADDPHCTCPDCLADHEARMDYGPVDAPVPTKE